MIIRPGKPVLVVAGGVAVLALANAMLFTILFASKHDRRPLNEPSKPFGYGPAPDLALADEAIEAATIAIEADPAYPVPYIQRARAQMKKGLIDNAIRDCSEALRLDPSSAWAHFNHGLALDWKGAQSKALIEYDAACRLDPIHSWSFNNRAWIMATSVHAELRNSSLALESATRACELTHWSECEHIMTLAAAYAEAGDFASAVRWQNKVLGLLSKVHGNYTELARHALDLYIERRPLRVPVNRD
jgi:tetratricopeptide (TPR) repeat protein